MKITLKDYHWQCGDGCCDEYGVELYVDENLIDTFADESAAYHFVLTNLLGHTVEEQLC